MSDIAIRVERLGKKYQLRHRQFERYATLRDILTSQMLRLSRSATSIRSIDQSMEDFWAIKDLTFDVLKGEVIGIIGRNGAGKSTLLKILSRITEPTEGSVCLRGQVASLLEVGTGFHPELSGRENIYLNGAILGMSKSEIQSNFDEIVAFAEIEKFLDTPVKRYSSGMYVRLAFAVAAHLSPDILIVDEVLAVGDAEFQKKCLGKMEQVASGLGRTVLFVSHNLSVVRRLCRRGVVLDRGRLVFFGEIDHALSAYSNLTAQTGNMRMSDTSKPTITRVNVDEQDVGTGHFKLEIEFSSPWRLDPVLIGAVVYNQLGMPVFGFNTWQDALLSPPSLSHGIATLIIKDLSLHSGLYRVAVFLGEKTQNYDVVENAAVFHFMSPEPLPAGLSSESIGAMRVSGSWTIKDNR